MPKCAIVAFVAASTAARSAMSTVSPCSAIGRVESRDGLTEQRLVAVPDRHLAAGGKDARGDRKSDALGGAGDNRNAIFQIIDIHK